MNQKFFTYVLKSERDGHLYVGLTSDLRRRIEEHNKGKVRSTKSRKPLKLVYYEEYEDKTSGRKREMFLKSGQGRLYLKNRLKELANEAVSPAKGGPRVQIPASPPLSEGQWHWTCRRAKGSLRFDRVAPLSFWMIQRFTRMELLILRGSTF